jgi:uncharacterized coiled-coil DUF342 family protein
MTPTRLTRERLDSIRMQVEHGWLPPSENPAVPHLLRELVAEIDALEAERDEADADFHKMSALKDELIIHYDKLKARVSELEAALSCTRGQWIHSVNAKQCLAALGENGAI